MSTGIKKLDAVVNKHGITVGETKNVFQFSTKIYKNSDKIHSLRLPYCMLEAFRQSESDFVMLYCFFVPYKHQRLASFLVSPNGELLEKVFYQQRYNYKTACRKVEQKLINKIKYSEQNTSERLQTYPSNNILQLVMDYSSNNQGDRQCC